MLVHHVNAATLCPFPGRWIDGEGSLTAPGRMVCHCLVVETSHGLVLVDTGLGLDDCARPGARLGRMFSTFVRPTLDPDETCARQVERLGFRREDVRHIVPTHLDLDHAGGLSDFPSATVHTHATEHESALHPRSMVERERYRQSQWAHGPKWALYRGGGERWFGFDAIRAVPGTDEEILLVPLHGHTRGHCGVAVRTPTGWLLHAGDAYFFGDEMRSVEPRCPVGLSVFQRLVAVDDASRVRNQSRPRELKRAHGDGVKLFCAHDPREMP